MAEKEGLDPSSTLTEVFNFMDTPEGGAQVVPVTVHEDPKDTRIAIFIRGEHEMAATIYTRIMTVVDDLFDLAEQQAANPPE